MDIFQFLSANRRETPILRSSGHSHLDHGLVKRHHGLDMPYASPQATILPEGYKSGSILLQYFARRRIDNEWAFVSHEPFKRTPRQLKQCFLVILAKIILTCFAGLLGT